MTSAYAAGDDKKRKRKVKIGKHTTYKYELKNVPQNKSSIITRGTV